MEFFYSQDINSSIIVSNDSTSKKIRINKNTNFADFYSKILSHFPFLNNLELFYFEGYMKEKFTIKNEEEYIIANKKGIEYFYLSENKKSSDLLDYLKYYSVILFSPVKLLNKEFQINDRKKMQMQRLETINEIDENNSSGGNNNMNNVNNINNINNINNFNQMNILNNNNIVNNFNCNNANNSFQGFPDYNNINVNNNIINNSQNIQNGLYNLDEINKELLNAFMYDKDKYNLMISTMDPLLFQLCYKKLEETNKNGGLLNSNYNNSNFNNDLNKCQKINNLQNFYNNYQNQYNNYYNNNINNFNNNNYYNNYINNNINNNSNNMIKNEPDKLIPEYETIDTESDPVNKYIENAINYSSAMKHAIINQKSNYPDYFINIEETLSSSGLLSNKKPSKNDYKYLLCLLGKILENQGIEVGIYKNKPNKDRIDLSAIQFIFSGLINQKKYRLKFSRKFDKNYFVCITGDATFKKKFIKEFKLKISNKILINENSIILTNPRHNNNFLFIDLAFNPNIGQIDENILKTMIIDNNEIIACESFPLLAGCILSPNIFMDKFNKYYNKLRHNAKRGGEEYIIPLDWTAFGLNISKKYDFGNDIWLGNKNNYGEFAVAYYGINNLMKDSSHKVNSLMGNSQTGKTFLKAKNIRNPGQTCKSGAYFYKNPKFAENSCEKINIGGFQYKIMFMCRVNPSKIMQPENFKDCWILSPTPDEVRPYKILIKKIPIIFSPLALGSEAEIKICIDPPKVLFDILEEKDESYFNKFNIGPNNFNNNFNNIFNFNNNFNNMFNFNNNFNMNMNMNNKYDWILREYTGLGSSRINNYLRNNIIPPFSSEKDIKSNIWCLHKAITESIPNVPDNITVYRGIKVKIPIDIGTGTKFYFREFLSCSKDINVARSFAASGTLLIISIQNNGINGKKVYCRDIENISQFRHEKEIIFTAFCQFIITDVKKEQNLDIIYLTCDGYNF